ncbi:MAG: hypothetical protein ACTHWA_12305 [Arachnia sp.]
MPTAPISPYAAPSLQCDIVMKGGITSGVIYPRAVAELAKTYRLSHVGGASAGAIAAAAAAAAELGRDSGGFEQLDRMPDELAAIGGDGMSTLASFFQPTRTAAPLFRLLFSVTAKQHGKAVVLVGGLLKSFWIHALVGALPGLAIIILSAMGDGIASVAGVLGGVVLMVIGSTVAVVAGAVLSFGRIAQDGFGMCTGMEGDGGGGAQPLTPWLYEKTQSLAGRDSGAPPLTFGDLHAAGITLRVMTTNLSRHQPMAMPWSTKEFYFDVDEMRRLFPKVVVDWMVNPGLDSSVTPQPRLDQGRTLYPWPAANDLPVVVATRMSLSFPALISAVRLYAVDYTQPENHVKGIAGEDASADNAVTFSSVWFTDGGLCANLPVHFFDTPLPKHPTFALNLGPFPPGREKSENQAENSYLPARNQGGLHRPWFSLPTRGLGAWGAFALTMVHTAREWVDGAQMVMPGYRDRIVTVHHDHSEGGMNLSMPPKTVTDLAERGRLGAVNLVRTFAGDKPGLEPTRAWDNHRWIRLRTATSGLAQWLRHLESNYRGTTSCGTAYSQLAGLDAQAPLPSYQLSEEERQRLNARTAALMELAAEWGSDARPLAGPKPAPRLRLVPDDGTAAGIDVSGEGETASDVK